MLENFDRIDIAYSPSCREVDTYTTVVLYRGTDVPSFFDIRLPRGPYSCFLWETTSVLGGARDVVLNPNSLNKNMYTDNFGFSLEECNMFRVISTC